MELTEKAIDDLINSGKKLRPSKPTLFLSPKQAEILRKKGLIPPAKPYECDWGQLAKDLGVEDND